MSKELTPLEALGYLYFNCLEYGNKDKHYRIIHNALKKQEEDKKLLNEQAKSNRYLMEQIKQSQNKLKALEIIIEKLVCLKAIHLNKNVEEYNIFVDLTNSSPYHLTQEEYDLLKEVLL